VKQREVKQREVKQREVKQREVKSATRFMARIPFFGRERREQQYHA